jgi:glucoamylase
MRDTGLGVFLVDLPTAKLGTETTIRFTFYWPAKKSWEGADFEVRITV